MALLYTTTVPKDADIGILQTYGFAENRRLQRWETRRVSRENERKVRTHLPHLGLLLSVPEQHVLQLNSATAETAPNQFWVASNIPERSLQLTTCWRPTDPASSIAQACREAATLLGCPDTKITPAKHLLAKIKEDQT